MLGVLGSDASALELVAVYRECLLRREVPALEAALDAGVPGSLGDANAAHCPLRVEGPLRRREEGGEARFLGMRLMTAVGGPRLLVGPDVGSEPVDLRRPLAPAGPCKLSIGVVLLFPSSLGSDSRDRYQVRGGMRRVAATCLAYRQVRGGVGHLRLRWLHSEHIDVLEALFRLVTTEAVRGLVSAQRAGAGLPLALVLAVVVFLVHLRYQLYIRHWLDFPCLGDYRAVRLRLSLLSPLELAA